MNWFVRFVRELEELCVYALVLAAIFGGAFFVLNILAKVWF